MSVEEGAAFVFPPRYKLFSTLGDCLILVNLPAEFLERNDVRGFAGRMRTCRLS